MSEEEEKYQYFHAAAEKWLDGTVSAYDSIAAKASGLLGIAVPLLAGLLGFFLVALAADSKDLGVYLPATTAYSLLLLGSVWFLCQVIFLRPLVLSGRNPAQ